MAAQLTGAAKVSGTGRPAGRRTGWRSSRGREALAGFAFISPWMIGFLIFTLGPMIASLVLSFTNYSVLAPTKNVGLANYRTLFSDPMVSLALRNTFLYAVLYVPLVMIVALALAVLLNQVGRAVGLFRTIFYLPVMTPPVAVGALFLLLLNGDTGLINRGLALVGITGPSWTTDPHWIKPGIALMGLWGVGGTVVIYLAALKNVPQDLKEAAMLDGAGPWRRFRAVTVPMISGVLFFTFIVLTISSLQMFDQVYTMYFGAAGTNSGNSASLFYVIYLFQQAFTYFRMGYASAMAWLLFLIIIVITLVQVRVSRRFVYYESEEG